MKIQGANQNNYNNYKNQQSFSALTLAGSKVSVTHLFTEGSRISNKARRLIEETGCSDQETQKAILDSIRGLARLDDHLQAVTDIRQGSKPETLLMRMSSGPWDEVELPVDLGFNSIIEGALQRIENLCPDYREKMISRINNLTTVTDDKKGELKELLDIVPPIAQEVGFRFNKVYSALRKSLGLD